MESDLPGQGMAPPAMPDESQLPSANAPIAPEPRVDVPDENVLPTDPNGGRPEEGIADEALPGRRRPILRLDYSGHSSLILALEHDPQTDLLASAGYDKDIHLWRRDPRGRRPWVHDRVIRWQVARGPRGRIYTLASKGKQLAMAGHGAMGSLGEIWVVNTDDGSLVSPVVDTESGHNQVVQQLRWAPGKTSMLASQDLVGRLMTWKPDNATGMWSGDTLVDPDGQKYGSETAARLAPFRSFVPLAFRGATEILTASFVEFGQDGIPEWKIDRIDTVTKQLVPLGQQTFKGLIRHIETSRDGSTVVATDPTQSVSVWTLNSIGNVVNFQKVNVGAVPTFISICDQKKWLLVGTSVPKGVEQQNVSRLQVWDLNTEKPKLLSESFPRGISPAGRVDGVPGHAVVAFGNSLVAYELDANGQLSKEPVDRLESPVSGVRSVAFTKDTEQYQIAVERQNATAKEDKQAFDLKNIRLLDSNKLRQEDLLPAMRLPVPWSIREVRSENTVAFDLMESDQVAGRLPFRVESDGYPQVLGTAKFQGGNVVIVTTQGRNNVYIYEAKRSPKPRLLRQFRGHAGPVRSASVSADQRYLVTGADDATLCIWNLATMHTDSDSVNRWGAEFQVEDNQLTVTSVREDGPLYFRGVREGDRILGLRWKPDEDSIEVAAEPDEMLGNLKSLPADTLLTFVTSRFGRPLDSIQSYPAWRPLATLLLDQDREWAFWTPAGFYDASFNGHRRFGWQINRGIDMLPDFFRAAQFRERLERPELMRRLLLRGSLPAAMRSSVGRLSPPPGESAIVSQYLTKPSVRITSPKEGSTIEGDRLTVKAAIQIPLGANLVAPKAFASGVPAVSRRRTQIRSDSETGGTIEEHEWEFRLPRQRDLLLEVAAATDSKAADRVTMRLKHLPDRATQTSASKARKPRLHLLAIGIGDYRDPQIQSLDFPAKATSVVAQTLRQHASKLYRVSTEQLVDRQATRPLWKIYAEMAAEELAQSVSPDDLVVMYLCGHGLKDRRTDRWYFVTADANYQDLMNDQYADCLSFDDLSLLSSLPCRKLAILDSCHSGAVQPLMKNSDLKGALRLLQSDVVITLTASEGDEEAAEVRETGLGRFTTRLIQAFQGQADEDRDGEVTLAETIQYVSSTVATDSQVDGMSQHPTASPPYLIETLDLPLTRPAR